MFQYAGIPLSEPEGTDIAAWIYANIQPQQLFPLAALSWTGFIADGPLLNPSPETQLPIHINTFFWPWGASRFARAHFVVTTAQLTAIRKNVDSNGARSSANLIFSDGVNKVTAKMWMLPAIPLAQAIPTLGMSLLTLVCDRYWWWGQLIDLTVIDDATQWTDLYASIGTALGVAINVDPVAAAYATPTTAYDTAACPAPPILDAIAFSVQQRIVRDVDGTVKAMNYATAEAIAISNLLSLDITPYAGGQFDFTVNKPSDLAIFPATVAVVFPATGTGLPPSGFFEVDVSLASLNLPNFLGITGSPWQKILHRYEIANYAGAITNIVALDALANQLAGDWYNWQLAFLDQQFVGIFDWDMEGLHNVEWAQTGGKITTHVQRGQFNPSEDLLYEPGATGVFPPEPGYTCYCYLDCRGLPMWAYFTMAGLFAFVSPVPCSPPYVPPSSSISSSSAGYVCSFGPIVCLSWASPLTVSNCKVCANPAPFQYVINASGFVSGPDDNLSQFNGKLTFQLTSSSSTNCIWTLVDIDGLGLSTLSFGSTAWIEVNSLTNIAQVIFDNNLPTNCGTFYQLPLSQFDCSASNTLPIKYTTSCTGGTVPVSVKVIPSIAAGPAFSNPVCTGSTSLTFAGNAWIGVGYINGGSVKFFIYGTSLSTLVLQIENIKYPVDPNSNCSALRWTIPNGVNNCVPITFTITNGPCGGPSSSGGSGFSSSGSAGCMLPNMICVTVIAAAIVNTGDSNATCTLCPGGTTPASWTVTFPVDYFNISPVMDSLNGQTIVVPQGVNLRRSTQCMWITIGYTHPQIQISIWEDSDGNFWIGMTVLGIFGGNGLGTWLYEFPNGAVNCTSPVTLVAQFANNPTGNPLDQTVLPDITITPNGIVDSSGNDPTCNVCFSVSKIGGSWIGSAMIGGNFTVVTLVPAVSPTDYVLIVGGVNYKAWTGSTCAKIVFLSINIGTCQFATVTFDVANNCCVASFSSSGPSSSSFSASSSSCGFGSTICGEYAGTTVPPSCSSCHGTAPASWTFDETFAGFSVVFDGPQTLDWGGDCIWQERIGTIKTGQSTAILIINANGSATLTFKTPATPGLLAIDYVAVYEVGAFACEGPNTLTLLSSSFPVTDTLPATVTLTGMTPADTCQGSVCMTNSTGFWDGFATVGGLAVEFQLWAGATPAQWTLIVGGDKYIADQASTCDALKFVIPELGKCLNVVIVFTASTECCLTCGCTSGEVYVDQPVSGNYTWTAPAGVTCVRIRAWGGGGDGHAGTAVAIDGLTSSGAGAGGGGYAESILAVTPGSIYTYGVASNFNGPLDATIFTGDSDYCQGGCGDNGGSPGGGPTPGIGGIGGGGGGAALSNHGDIEITGASGTNGTVSAVKPGAPGGAGANGGGAGGAGGAPSVAGSPGNGPGGGGGGGGADGLTDTFGGTGADGRIIISCP